jgi:hypothetical protein
MKAKVIFSLSVFCLLFSLGGLIITHLGQAQQMTPISMGCNKILWDYDSGWVAINPGEYLIINHNLGGDSSEYFVYFAGSSNGSTTHQGNFGFRTGSDSYNKGACWDSCDATKIKVYRNLDDYITTSVRQWNYFRVRILKNQ